MTLHLRSIARRPPLLSPLPAGTLGDRLRTAAAQLAAQIRTGAFTLNSREVVGELTALSLWLDKQADAADELVEQARARTRRQRAYRRADRVMLAIAGAALLLGACVLLMEARP